MGREISLFTDYHQKENSLTNYCGLILKLLYQENPQAFEEVLTSLVDGQDVKVGPLFTQQEKQTLSIPDLAIVQRGFSVFVETKLSDWFYDDQIQKHIKGLAPGDGAKILLLLSNFDAEDQEVRFQKVIQTAKQDGISIGFLTFENLIRLIKSVSISERFKSVINEFEIYLDWNNCLPKWKWLLDVVNCAGSMEEIEKCVYMCPDTGGAYNHRRAKFFGPYARKTVNTIFHIDALISVGIKQSEIVVKWNNTNNPSNEMKQRALEAINHYEGRIEENQQTSLQVFLLSSPEQTDFKKNTQGGMFASKKYFWNIAKECKTTRDLAEKLNGKSWDEFSTTSDE